MIQFIVQIIIGLIGGFAGGLQAVFAGIMGQKVGDMTSVFFTYVIGGGMISLILLLSGGGQLGEWRTIPRYAFLAGPLGLIIVGSLSYTVPRLGAATATTIFVLSWLGFSTIVDHFGWFNVPIRTLDMPRLFGLASLILGTWLVVR